MGGGAGCVGAGWLREPGLSNVCDWRALAGSGLTAFASQNVGANIQYGADNRREVHILDN